MVRVGEVGVEGGGRRGKRPRSGREGGGPDGVHVREVGRGGSGRVGDGRCPGDSATNKAVGRTGRVRGTTRKRPRQGRRTLWDRVGGRGLRTDKHVVVPSTRSTRSTRSLR